MGDKHQNRWNIIDGVVLLIAIAACIFAGYAVTDTTLKVICCSIFAIAVVIQLARLLHTGNLVTSRNSREQKVQSICLVNEEGEIIREWDVFNKIGLVIGKSSKNHEVDIDLKDCTYASLIDPEHALLNFAAGHWYVEDLYSKNGVYLKKADDNRKYLLSKDNPCQVGVNDTLFIGKTKLILK